MLNDEGKKCIKYKEMQIQVIAKSVLKDIINILQIYDDLLICLWDEACNSKKKKKKPRQGDMN